MKNLIESILGTILAIVLIIMFIVFSPILFGCAMICICIMLVAECVKQSRDKSKKVK